MKKFIKALIGSYEKFDRNYWLRREDGKITIGKPDVVYFETDEKDDVEFVIFEEKSRKLYFWKINGTRFNALASKSFIDLPKETCFVNVDIIEDYYERFGYVIYEVNGSYGVLFVNDSEIKIIFSHENNFSTPSIFNNIKQAGNYNIFYTNNMFFDVNTNKYHVLNDKIEKLRVVGDDELIIITTDKDIKVFTIGLEQVDRVSLEIADRVEFSKIQSGSKTFNYLFYFNCKKLVKVTYFINTYYGCNKTINSFSGIEIKYDYYDLKNFILYEDGKKKIYDSLLNCISG